MRDPKRIEKVLAQLRSVWYQYPDMRFFQLVEFLKSKMDDKSFDTFYLEDDKLSEFLKDFK